MRPLAPVAAAILAAAIAAGCSSEPIAPSTRTLSAVSISGGTGIPVTHYCTPASTGTEQWVSAGNAQLLVYPDGTFHLDEADGHGSAQYHMNGTTKVYDIQSATGGTNGLAGRAVSASDGSQTLRFEAATSIYGDPASFTGAVFRDSAVITHVMKCDHPVGPDSMYAFRIVLR